MDKRRTFSDKTKFEVVLEVLKGQRTMAEIAAQFEVHPIQVGRWKKVFLERGPSMFFSGKTAEETEWESERERQMKKIGEKGMELDFAKKT